MAEKKVSQFLNEMVAAGFDFEYKATNNDGMVVKSAGWVDDDTVYTEISPTLQHVPKAKSR